MNGKQRTERAAVAPSWRCGIVTPPIFIHSKKQVTSVTCFFSTVKEADMSKFFEDTMQGLIEAVEIQKSNLPLTSHEDMPAFT